MNFELIDNQLINWVKENNLYLYTKHPDGEIRSVSVVNKKGEKVQIGIAVYSKIKIIISGSNLAKKRVEYRTSIKNFTKDLDEILSIIKCWLEWP